MKKINKKIKYLFFILPMFLLVACQSIDNFFTSTRESIIGLPGTVMTYDENSQLVDKVVGSSVSIQSDNRFDVIDAKGSVSKESSVLNITVSGREMIHVGSTLIFAEEGLQNYFEDYSKYQDIKNGDGSVPFVNRIYNSFKNMTSGKSKLILIRSQSGAPLATFFGDRVSLHSKQGVPNTTNLLVDGKRLTIYRADYTIYDVGLLEG